MRIGQWQFFFPTGFKNLLRKLKGEYLPGDPNILATSFVSGIPEQLSIEINSIDSLILMKLKNPGYEFLTRSSIGSVNVIKMLPDGRMASGSDKRGLNTACGY